ncbi:hypothetical protein BDZ89DRAFT_1041591 [Hymenopellis radicata]|nr:hypothetical protein BDZ89DRAFT_1041591 [Hymenopellis radicata]
MLSRREEDEAADIRQRGLIYLGNIGPATADAIVSQGEGRPLKIKWCEARARMLRWREQVELLIKEMRRVVAFRKWKADWWKQRADPFANADDPMAKGACAYALAAADSQLRNAEQLELSWGPLKAAKEDLLKGLPITHILEIELDAKAKSSYEPEDEDDTIDDEEPV